MAGTRRALVVATYEYADGGLRRLAAPAHDAESFADVLKDEAIAGFDVTMLVNQPHYVVGEAIADFYGEAGREDLTLLYFTGHGVKDDEGRLYLAMTNTRREALMFTAISGAQLNDAMDASRSRRKVLVLDCCYSGAFPAGRTAKADESVQTLERFQGKGRAVLTASDSTQYAFEGDDLRGSGTSSVFTRYLVEAISSGAADLDEDGDIALDELYSYVYERVVAEVPQQRPKKQEDVDGRILIARNVHWKLPEHLRHAIESPISAQRLSAVQELGYLYQAGNDVVRTSVSGSLSTLASDDSRSVSSAATALLDRIRHDEAAPVTPSEVPETRPDVPEEHPVAPPSSVAPVAPAASAASSAPPSSAAPAAASSPSRAHAEAPESGTSADDFPASVVLGLVVAAGVILLLSRTFPFDADNGAYAADLGYATLPWVLVVVLPLVVATQLVILRGTGTRRVGLAVGLIAGVTLIQLEQVLTTTTLAADPDTGVNAGGPGWWLAVLGTGVLLVCLVVVVRRGVLRAGPGVEGNWLTVLGIVVVIAALFVWLSTFADFYLWWPANGPGLLMAAVALPVAVLALNGPQRLVALVGVTVFGLWIVMSTVHALFVDTYWSDVSSGVAAASSALASVVGCYIAQARLPQRVSKGPAAGTAPRR